MGRNPAFEAGILRTKEFVPLQAHIDPRLSTREIREAILAQAAERGETLTTSKADRLAKTYRREHFEPDVPAGPFSGPRRCVEWLDPTGNRAADNLERRELSRRSSRARKEG